MWLWFCIGVKEIRTPVNHEAPQDMAAVVGFIAGSFLYTLAGLVHTDSGIPFLR